MPRFLFVVNYKEENYHIGDLNNFIVLHSEILDEEIRDISQVKIEVKKLVDKLIENKAKIENVQFCLDECLMFTYNGEDENLEKCLKEVEIKTEKLSL
jgi:CRISPR-associated protein Csh2